MFSGFCALLEDPDADMLDLSYRGINEGIRKLPLELFNIPNIEKITSLDLSHNELTTLPTEIGNLKNLVMFYLCGNRLKALPSEIGKLSNLVTLFLSQNQLKELPNELWKLNNLRVLSLAGNSLTVLPTDVNNLGNLEVLYLFQNRATRLPLTKSCDTSEDLSTALALWDAPRTSDYQKIERRVHALLENAAENKLNLKGATLREIPPKLFSLSQLIEQVTILDLSNNKLAWIPSEIGNLVHLTKLCLRKNKIAELPRELGNLSKLTCIEIDNNPLVEEIKEICLNSFTKLYQKDDPLIVLPNGIWLKLLAKNNKWMKIELGSIKAMKEYHVICYTRLPNPKINLRGGVTLPLVAISDLSSLAKVYWSENPLTMLSVQPWMHLLKRYSKYKMVKDAVGGQWALKKYHVAFQTALEIFPQARELMPFYLPYGLKCTRTQFTDSSSSSDSSDSSSD